MTKKQLAEMIDHTLLKAFAVEEDFRKLCEESVTSGFKMVAVNSAAVALCKKLLGTSGVNVGAAISFPLGQTSIETKVFETENAIGKGAEEIDYVINIAELKNGNYSYIETEMQEIVQVCRKNKIIVKVIFENCYLTQEEIRKAASIALTVKPDFIKTSTGFGTSGAKVEDVLLMKSIVKKNIKVKASGGIRDWRACEAMIAAGAERIGTSNGVHILQEFEQEHNFKAL